MYIARARLRKVEVARLTFGGCGRVLGLASKTWGVSEIRGTLLGSLLEGDPAIRGFYM